MVGAGTGVGEKLEKYREALKREEKLKQKIADYPGGMNTPEGKKLLSSYRQAQEHLQKLAFL